MKDAAADVKLEFGSVRRAGRELPAYQADRAQRYAQFAVRLLAAQRQQLAARDAKLRELWEGNAWLERQREQLAATLAGDEARIAELRAWAAELEQARDWVNEESATRLQMLDDQQARLDSAQRALDEARRAGDAARARGQRLAREIARIRAHPLVRFASLLGLLRIPNVPDEVTQGEP